MTRKIVRFAVISIKNRIRTLYYYDRLLWVLYFSKVNRFEFYNKCDFFFYTQVLEKKNKYFNTFG